MSLLQQDKTEDKGLKMNADAAEMASSGNKLRMDFNVGKSGRQYVLGRDGKAEVAIASPFVALEAEIDANGKYTVTEYRFGKAKVVASGDAVTDQPFFTVGQYIGMKDPAVRNAGLAQCDPKEAAEQWGKFLDTDAGKAALAEFRAFRQSKQANTGKGWR